MITPSSSSDITLSCVLNGTGNEVLEFVLEVGNEDLHQINLTCDGSERLISFTGNSSVLYRRYSDQLMCEVYNFTSPDEGEFIGAIGHIA